MICPFVADQPFWGRRMHSVGVASAPVPQQHLTVERLAAALAVAVTDPAVRKNAARLAALIREEHGTAAAVARLEPLTSGRARR